MITSDGHYSYFAAPLFAPVYENSIDSINNSNIETFKNSFMRIYRSDLTHIFMQVDIILSIIGDWEVNELVCVNNQNLYFFNFNL